MEDEREKWISETIDTTRDMSRAVAPIGLFDKIMVDIAGSRVMTIPKWQRNLGAAAAILLLVLNVGIGMKYASGDSKDVAQVENEGDAFLSDYELYDL